MNHQTDEPASEEIVKAAAMFFCLLEIGFLMLQAAIAFQDCSSAVVGVADNNIIPDSSFTATSFYDPLYAPVKARFNSDMAWAPKTHNDANDYLQIDLGKVFVICAVATKGAVGIDEWTTEYKISTSLDNTTYTWYPANEAVQAFTGNTDRDTSIKNTLDVPVLARLIRFLPTDYNRFKSLRVELYGIEYHAFSCKSLSIGVANVARIPNSSMTSSTNYNASIKASNGRLSYTAGPSWCSAKSDSSPYLQINLNGYYVICGVATQGDHKSGQWVQTYQIQTSTDGMSFIDHKENNAVKEFVGNVDANTIVQNVFLNGAVGRYIRINPVSSYGSSNCMRTELYGVHWNSVCSKLPIGISSPSIIPNHRFTASSSYDNHNNYAPSNARLRNSLCWTAGTNDPWLQIDLGSVMFICAVATQGSPKHDEFVKKFKLRMSLDNIGWKYYQENNTDKEFSANVDFDSIVTNTLAVPSKAKLIRFYPTRYQSYMSMRVEVYGVQLACSTPFGLEKTIKDGGLYGNASVCSRTSSESEYFQIDFGQIISISGIATQGDHTTDKWVKAYTITYSTDGSRWAEYREGNAAKVFQGNSDKSTIVVRWLTRQVTARYVKIHPKTWNIAICMRIEVFGCQTPTSPQITELRNHNLAPSCNSYVELTCKVQEPLVQYIEWFSNGIDVTSLSGGLTRGMTFVKSVLQVNYTNAFDVVREYQCARKDGILVCRRSFICRSKYAVIKSRSDSLKSAQVQILIETTPMLSSPTLQNIVNNSAIVQWTYPVNSPVKSVLIRYWNHQTSTTVNLSYPAVNHTMTGLSVCTHYNVSIKAFGELADGPWSHVRMFKTDSELPSAAPSSVTAESKTSESILVRWKEPVRVTCSPDGYKILFSTTHGGHEREVVIQGIHNTSYTLTNLNKWTNYYISVKVHNKKGYGPPSTVVKGRTMEDKPKAAPDNFQVTTVNATSVCLSWNLPPTSKRNGIIRGFKISYRDKSVVSCQFPRISIPGNSTLHYIIGNLDRDAEYAFKILAYTIKEGPYSMEVTGKADRIKNVLTKKHQDPKQVCAVETTLSYILIGIIVILITIAIKVLIYIRNLRNHIKDFDSKPERNFNGNSPDQSIYENTGYVSHGGIQMTELTSDTSSVYEDMDHFQEGQTFLHLERSGNSATENNTNYKTLEFENYKQRRVYVEFNPNMKKKETLENDAGLDESIYQSLDEDGIDPSHQGLSLYVNTQ